MCEIALTLYKITFKSDNNLKRAVYETTWT